MNSKPVARLVAFLIVLTLMSCSGTKPTETPAITATVPSLTPEHTLMPISTPVSPSTPTLIPSPTPISHKELLQTCITSDKTNKAKIALHGIAVFDNLVPISVENAIETIYLRDLEKSNIKALPTQGPFENFFGISPDHQKLLYEYGSLSNNDYRLIVADSSGKTLADFDNRLNGGRWDYFNWQDNESIRVVQHEPNMVIPGLYNPFTQEYKSLRTDWPDIYVGDRLRNWKLDDPAIAVGDNEGANIVYDPYITRVVYPKNGEIVSLTDVETGKELASIHLPHWGKIPRWSPDGKNLVLIASTKADSAEALDEFFIVSRDGSEFKQLTYLSDIFEQITIVKYAWSPNGKQIVFLFNPDTVFNTEYTQPEDIELQSEMAILDVNTGAVTTLCFPSISVETYLYGGAGAVNFVHLQPVWSPDGNQIMLAQWNADSSAKKRKYSVWVVDLPSLKAVKIDENRQPAGWMAMIP